MTLLSLLLGRIHHLSSTDGLELIDELEAIPDKISQILAQADHIKQIAEKYAHVEGMLFMGRLINYPVALEGALKMKEISYVHADGYSAGEMKHSPIALVEPALFTLTIAVETAGPVAAGTPLPQPAVKNVDQLSPALTQNLLHVFIRHGIRHDRFTQSLQQNKPDLPVTRLLVEPHCCQ